MNPTDQINFLYDVFARSSGVTTDSRKINDGSIFFALKGERFDGNRFALKAIEQGAILAVVSDPNLAENDNCFLVEDTLVTLQQLARHHRRQFDIPFLAITGSNGKTTTKELTYAVLSKAYQTYATRGNLNNHIGVPLTLLDIGADAELAIVEMGANHVGEIGFLCSIAEPEYGLITNVGKAHLEGFGGIKGVIKGKGEMFRYLEANKGTAFVNLLQPHLSDMARGVEKIIGFGTTESQPYIVNLTDSYPFLSLEWCYNLEGKQEIQNIQTSLYGKYNFHNILAAIAVGWYFKVPPIDIKSAIEAYVPANNRSQIAKHGTNVFYLDAYNANPVSMRLALETFGALEETNKVTILGDMKELGHESTAEHQAIIDLLNELTDSKFPISNTILVGEEFYQLSYFVSEKLKFYRDTGALKDWFSKQKFTDTHFLIKGSRSIGLERLLDE
ncbi:MAG: UDP-N-acetylmuramoyl-tripeptide--D-alanyl-D-alanine ligase [Bacteroidota bacterium]